MAKTNDRGGFSSGTVAEANTRQYHALLLTGGSRYRTIGIERGMTRETRHKKSRHGRSSVMIMPEQFRQRL